MEHTPKKSLFKILLLLGFALVLNNKVSAHHLLLNTNSLTESFSLNDLKDHDLERIDSINIEGFEEEVEEEFSDDFSADFQNKNTYSRKSIYFNLYLNLRSLSLEKKRYYILYCQLKAYL